MNRLLEDLFQAYFDARKNKRNTISALKFEKNFEKNIFDLYNEIISGRYAPSQSICFVVDHPVKREIFAADFKDRIIHHLIYNYISPIFERHFIFDTYSCRTGKGVHLGIKRINRFIRSCSNNYKNDCYVLKLDIQGYFMSMDKNILYNQVKKRLLIYKNKNRLNFDLKLILELIEKTIFCDVVKNCKIKGRADNWKDLPQSKSLFYCAKNRGLPIGNLTSQLFGNIYLNDFDYFVKHDLKCRHYGRYVDDFVLIHRDKDHLKSLIVEIKRYLLERTKLKLHPKKIYLQHFSKGLVFLGVYIKPYRIYLKNRTKGSIRNKVLQWNKALGRRKLSKEEKEKFLSFINSVLGLAKHCNSYNLRKKILNKELSVLFYNDFNLNSDYSYLKLKTRK